MYTGYNYWGTEHLVMMLGTCIAPFILIKWSAKADETQKERMAKILAALLVVNWGVYQVYRVFMGYWSVQFDLPLELCNWAIGITAMALWFKKQRLAELAFFWVLAGSIHGIITPDIHEPFPHLTYITFVIGHSGLVLSVFYAVFGLNLQPEKGALKRVFIASQVYLAVAISADFLLSANYGYLMSKPPGGSFLDLLHPWPYYILEMEIMGLVSYGLLYLPFWWRWRKERLLK